MFSFYYNYNANEQQKHNDVAVQTNFNRTFMLFKPYIIGKPNNSSAHNDQKEYSYKCITT